MITWMIHHVCDGQRMSYHTHGLDQHGSLELELNLIVAPKQAALFINLIGESIAAGRQYRSGEQVEEIFTVPFYLLETTPIHESFEGEHVLRIIFCDPQYKFPWDLDCESGYRNQLNDAEIRQMKRLLTKGGRWKGVLPS